MDNKNAGDIHTKNHIAALQNNINAIKTLVASIEGTIGPKGMDCMIVDEEGDFIITNDGVTILTEMDVTHPAALMLIHGAYGQEYQVGDGTTTMTIMAGQILESALYHIQRGVPVQRIIEGMQLGASKAIDFIKKNSVSIAMENFELLKNVAFVAGRGNQSIVNLVYEAANYIGYEKLKDSSFKLANHIMAMENGEDELIKGLILEKKPLNLELKNSLKEAKILIINDALEPELISEELQATESGFNQYIKDKEAFKDWLDKIIELKIDAVFLDRGIDAYAEQVLLDSKILVVTRIENSQLLRLAEHVNARPIKRNALNKPVSQLKEYCGGAKHLIYDSAREQIRIMEGFGAPTNSIILGSTSGALAKEKERVAKDVACAIQVALQGGVVPGGGAMEMACAMELEEHKSTFEGMMKYGVACIIDALKKPMYNIVENAGFKSLEKIDDVIEMMKSEKNLNMGIDCDTGEIKSMFALGIIDPAEVKIQALKNSLEIAQAILKINLILKGKSR